MDLREESFRKTAISVLYAPSFLLPARAPAIGIATSSAAVSAVCSRLSHLPPPTRARARPPKALIHETASTAAVLSRPAAWPLVLAFVCGGLFFTSAVTAAGAVYAVGWSNVRFAAALLAVVMRRVLKLLLAMLGATRSALFGSSETRWVDAWQALCEGLAEARKASAEGVQAVQMEARLYAAAVGAPGLRPLQYALDRLLPSALVPKMEAALEQALADFAQSNNPVRSARLKQFKVGRELPRLTAARMYDLGEDALAVDVEMDWASSLTARVEIVSAGVGARVPVTLHNLRFAGPVRLVVTGLQSTAPGFGALLLSFPTAPSIGLEVRVAGGEVTRLPWLRTEVQKTIKRAVAERLLWPQRIVIPAEVDRRQDLSRQAARHPLFPRDGCRPRPRARRRARPFSIRRSLRRWHMTTRSSRRSAPSPRSPLSRTRGGSRRGGIG